MHIRHHHHAHFALREVTGKTQDVTHDLVGIVLIFGTDGTSNQRRGDGILEIDLIRNGDEVIFFEPHYDSYPVCAAIAGAVSRFCTLRFPDFAIDFDELENCFSEKTRVLFINTPHNPTGKVFTEEELARLARALVAVDYRPMSLRVDSVTVASMRSAYLATRALLVAGRRRLETIRSGRKRTLVPPVPAARPPWPD